eukprot:TRINITY_DN990_c0_g2_i7.p1 TRINITY_DN990_c0_g2~~TRINITY_DN990_c0_g2_i7.p1  ORF type:complete len:249 (+),score=52.70 TRINITY_DN990_c0_g2_i7:508-1254(+)
MRDAPKEKAVEKAIAAEIPEEAISPKNHEAASDVAAAEECGTALQEKAVESAIAAETPAKAISPITAVPTVSPTANPTAAPTAIPTAVPTANPTAVAVPTANPTAVPTVVPTAVSTAVPPSKEFMISENVIFTNDSEEPVHAVILEIDTCMNPTVYLILLPDESQIRTEGKRLRRFDDVLSPEPPSEVFMIDEYVIFNDDSEGDVPVEIVEIDPSVHPTAYVILLPNGSQIRTEGKRLRRLVDVMQSE